MVSDMRSIIQTAEGCRGQPSAVIHDGRTLQSSCESGPRAGYDGYKRHKGSKAHMAVGTLGHLMALTVTPGDEQERAQVDALRRQVQQATGETVKLAWADQGYTGEQARSDAAESGIDLQVVKATRSEEGLLTATPALGRGRMAGPVQAVEPQFRTHARGAGRAAFRGLCPAKATQSGHVLGFKDEFTTPSNYASIRFFLTWCAYELSCFQK